MYPSVFIQPQTVNASQLQRASGKILRMVAVQKHHLVVKRDGYPVAAVMPYPDYEALGQLLAQRELVDFLDRIPPTTKGEEGVEADVLRAVHDVRHGKHKKR